MKEVGVYVVFWVIYSVFAFVFYVDVLGWKSKKQIILFVLGSFAISFIIDIIVYSHNGFSFLGVITLTDFIAFSIMGIVLFFDSRKK